VVELLDHADRAVDAVLTPVTAQEGLSREGWRVLLLLSRGGGRSMHAVSENLRYRDEQGIFELATLDAPVVAVFGALAGATSLNEMAVGAWGHEGPTVLHVSGERDYA